MAAYQGRVELLDKHNQLVGHAEAQLWGRAESGGLKSWGGVLIPIRGEPFPGFETGEVVLRLPNGQTGHVLFTNVRVESGPSGITETATIVGNGPAPFPV